MACANKILGLVQMEFDGTNIDPISNSVMINFGGEMGDGETITSSGKFYPSTTIKAGEVEAEVPVTADFNIDDYRGRCGLLTMIDDLGKTYIMRTATIIDAISTKSGEGKATLKWRGDPIEEI